MVERRVCSLEQDAGAILVEQRNKGNPRDYSVIVLNWKPPDVRDLNP